MQNIQLPFITLNNNSFKDLQKNVDTSISIIKNYNLQGEYFGNIQAKKAIVYFKIYNFSSICLINFIFSQNFFTLF